MQKVICVSEDVNKFIKAGNLYYISLTSICSDSDKEWSVDVYEDNKKEIWIGRFNLNHFKSVLNQ